MGMNSLVKQLLWPIVAGLAIGLVLLFGFPGLLPQTQPNALHDLLTQQPQPPVQGTENGNTADQAAAPIQADAVQSQLSRGIPSQGPVSYADAIALASPAVVNIFTNKIVEAPANPYWQDLYNDPFFRQFFGKQYLPNQQRMESSLGSGVIMDASGLVLTNFHVIKDADSILVALHDGRETIAQIVGSDPESDLALLAIGLNNLTPAPLSIEPPRVGDVVFAIGNPFGVGQTVSMGIVSATGRNQLGLAVFEDFIQTDAAVNPGNSGGALINTQGQLVGINTAIFSKSGGFQGISFAIPSPQASRVVNQIIENGRVVRGYLGMSMSEITQYALEQLAIPADKALVITELSPEGPAAQAGLLVGDVVTAIAGVPILSGVLTQKQVVNTPPGEYLTLEFYRQGVLMEANVLVGVRPS